MPNLSLPTAFTSPSIFIPKRRKGYRTLDKSPAIYRKRYNQKGNNIRVNVWFGYLKVPYDEPIEIYQQGVKESFWVAEWSVK